MRRKQKLKRKRMENKF